MTVKVEIVYDENRKEERTIEIKGSPVGTRLLNAIDKQINKELADDPHWRRWNLVSC